eukprot:4328807-Alexandrium_andersonii.AAC.1
MQMRAGGNTPGHAGSPTGASAPSAQAHCGAVEWHPDCAQELTPVRSPVLRSTAERAKAGSSQSGQSKCGTANCGSGGNSRAAVVSPLVGTRRMRLPSANNEASRL